MKKWAQNASGWSFWIIVTIVAISCYYITSNISVPSWTVIIWAGGIFYLLIARYYLPVEKDSTSDHVFSYVNEEKNIKSQEKAPKWITCNIAGVTYNNHQEIIKQISIGDTIKLWREPNNEFDKNAISVTYRNKQKGIIPRQSIGYIPREIAMNISHDFDEFATTDILPSGKVVSLSSFDLGKIGVTIKFRVPDKETLESDRLFFSYIAYPPPSSLPFLDIYEPDPSDWDTNELYDDLVLHKDKSK